MNQQYSPDRRFFTKIALVGGVAALSGCMSYPRVGGQPLPKNAINPLWERRDQEPLLKVGQGWEFKTINLFNSEVGEPVVHRINQITGSGAVTLGHVREKSTQREISSKLWSVSEELQDNALLRFDQAMPVVPSSLQPGFKEQNQSRYWVIVDDKIQDPYARLFWNVHTQVIGWEKLQVPAGTFDVARIERHTYFIHPDVFRTESTRTETLWYAPQLRYWVARERTGRYLMKGGNRRGGFMQEDAQRWEMTRILGAPTS